MRKFRFLMLLLVISLSLSFISCDRSYDEEEVYEAALLLIPKSAELNTLYWGEGLMYIKNPSTSSGAYHEADYISLEKYGFRTVEEMKNLTRDVFSKEYCDYIFSAAFTSVSDDEEIHFFARYYQKYEDSEGKIPVSIMVYEKFEPLLTDEVFYDLETLKVTHSKKDKVFVQIEATVTNKGGESQKRTKQIALVEENDGWRIDSATYLKYNEQASEYEDLENK